MEARRGSFEILRFSLFSREDNRAVAGLPLLLFSDLCTYTYIHMCVHLSSYICACIQVHTYVHLKTAIMEVEKSFGNHFCRCVNS